MSPFRVLSTPSASFCVLLLGLQVRRAFDSIAERHSDAVLRHRVEGLVDDFFADLESMQHKAKTDDERLQARPPPHPPLASPLLTLPWPPLF